MWQEGWAYEANAAQRGKVDCSGAFVWAYKRRGCSIYHGSNRIAREEVAALIPIKGAKLVPGMAAFKSRGPSPFGLNGYSLPNSYREGGAHYNGDVTDYYHVGLVDADISRVLNAQSPSTGFVASPIDKGWTHVGYLKQVDYGAGGASVAAATVTAPSGSTVNLRNVPSLKGSLLCRVPLGATVELLGPSEGGWTRVRWGARSGYMMSEFLEEVM